MLPENEEIGPRDVRRWKQVEIVDAVGDPFAVIGQGLVLESRASRRPKVEAEGQRLALMDEPAFDAEVALEYVAHPRGEHEKPRGHISVSEDRHALAVRAGLDAADPAGNEAHRPGQLSAHGTDEVIVENAVVPRMRAVEDAPVAHVDDLVECHGRIAERAEKTKTAQFFDLIAGDLLDPEFPGEDRVTVDQRDAITGPPEHDGCDGSGEPAADDGDLRVGSFGKRTQGIFSRHLEYLTMA